MYRSLASAPAGSISRAKECATWALSTEEKASSCPRWPRGCSSYSRICTARFLLVSSERVFWWCWVRSCTSCCRLWLDTDVNVQTDANSQQHCADSCQCAGRSSFAAHTARTTAGTFFEATKAVSSDDMVIDIPGCLHDTTTARALWSSSDICPRKLYFLRILWYNITTAFLPNGLRAKEAIRMSMAGGTQRRETCWSSHSIVLASSIRTRICQWPKG